MNTTISSDYAQPSSSSQLLDSGTDPFHIKNVTKENDSNSAISSNRNAQAHTIVQQYTSIYSSTTTNTTFSDTHLFSPQSFESASESFQIKKLTKEIDSNSTISSDCQPRKPRTLDLYDYSCYSLKSSSS